MTVWADAVARPLRALHLDTTRSQILVFAVVATVVPTLATTCVSYTQNRRWLADKVTQELRGASSEAAREADLWLREQLASLRVSTSSPVVSEALTKAGRGNPDRETLGRLNDYLTSLRGRFPEFETIQVLEARGHVVTSSASRPGPGSVSLPLPLPVGRVRSLHPDDAFIGDPYWDMGLGKAVLVLAVPIHQADGRFFGALAAKASLQPLADILQRVSPSDSADLYLMTSQGSLVIKGRVSSADLMRIKVPKPTVQLLADKEGTVVTYKRADGQDMVGSLQRAPQLRWAAVAEAPRAEAFRQLDRLRTATVWILLALLVVVGLMAWVLGVRIVRPLGRLSGAAAKIAAGDLTADLHVGGGGEIGYVARVFGDVVTRLRERESRGELERLSVTDPLTGLYNRRHLMGTLANELQRSQRLRRTFSVLLLDVDHFKQYNDTQGHPAGDAVLVKIADILRHTTRGVDCVARYGGEEFVVMLIEATVSMGATVAERIRARVADEGGGKVTVSIGVAEYPAHGGTPEALIASADAAMYQAKSGGRNRTVVASGEPEKKRRRKGEA
jgi:diguanylate cyclase (GGDEF)-like protein